MHPLKSTLPLLALLFCCAGAHAQSLYKCTVNGTVTYSGAPCPGTPSTPVAVPPAQAPAPEAEGDLKRQQMEADKLEKLRLAREAADRRRDLAAGQAAQNRRLRCDKLALQVKWATEEADASAGFDKDELRQKAERLRASMATECPV